MSPEPETARDRTLTLMAKARCDQAFGDGYWENLSVGERSIRASYEQVVLDAVTRSAINEQRQPGVHMSPEPRKPMTFGELCCEVCGVSGSVTAMHRANPKGERGRWRCEPCLDTPPDPGVLAITDDFQTHNMALREDDLAPMSPEMIAWVRAQRKKST